jgi:hypothetical protein
VIETKEITVEPKNKFECGLNCNFLRRFDGILGGTWWCNLYSDKLIYIKDQEILHRHSKCDGSYLFTMESTPEGPKFTV